jgi:hypothetical protein
MKRSLFFLLLAGAFSQCVEPYIPPSISFNPTYLVIDAFLDAAGTATVDVLHTIPLDSADIPGSENSANVTIESDDGVSWKLSEVGNGRYVGEGLPVDAGRKYRLKIRTIKNRSYESSFTPVKLSPPIDSVHWQINENGLELYVSTHDPLGESTYFRWFATETYEYLAPYPSGYVLDGCDVIPRPQDRAIEKCWKTDLLHEIHLSTTQHLVEDRISSFTLRVLGGTDVRLSKRYSFLVRQQVLTQEAFSYWTEVKKTTESLGGLFDPLPGQILGNIQSTTDPDEPVIGFFSAGSVSEERIFIDYNDLPAEYRAYLPPHCEMDTVPPQRICSITNKDIIVGPAYKYQNAGPPIFKGWLTATIACTDCRKYLDGGVTTRPAFWGN